MTDLGKILIASANAITHNEINGGPRSWQYDDVKHLIRQRRDCRNPQQRRELSRRIYKLARKYAREYCTSQTRQVFESFEALHKLERIHRSLSNPLPNISVSQTTCLTYLQKYLIP